MLRERFFAMNEMEKVAVAIREKEGPLTPAASRFDHFGLPVLYQDTPGHPPL